MNEEIKKPQENIVKPTKNNDSKNNKRRPLLQYFYSCLFMNSLCKGLLFRKRCLIFMTR